MKVLQVINSLNTGGAEKLVASSLPLYEKKDLHIDLMSLSNKSTDLKESLEVEFNGKIIGLTSESIYNPLLIFKIIPYLKKYDLIHVHLFPSLYWVVLAKQLSFSNIKIVYTEHSTYNRRRKKIVFKILDKYIYKKIHTVIAITDEVRDNLKSHLGSYKFRSITIKNGVDVSSINKAEAYLKSDFFKIDDFIMIQVSSFRFPKDQNTLIRSLKLLPEKIKLILVGQGGLLTDSKSLVEELKLSHRVAFLGNRNDVPRLLKTVDLVVLSSEYEGLSLSSIEGMAAEKPFIASNAPGLKEIVLGYGLLFETGNHEDLAQKVKWMYADKEDYKNISKKCYKRSQDFDIHSMIEKYIELFKNVINA